jgi:8-oxo-dGTP pyrophosphatase MutT (NUDIX family)/phosphohistidine phosphatase SixA
MTIYAAGAVLWREVSGQLLVAVIHRARYDDWSFPKGKQDPGECLPETAVREIREETGLKIKLGVRLKVVNYTVGANIPKEVHYWAARVSDTALAKSKFEPSEEVAEVTWKTPEDARRVLTYEFDQQILDEVMALYVQKSLRTKPVIILRHAKATPRSDWKGGKGLDDGHRPLLPAGSLQAIALVPLLGAFAPQRLVTSTWVRCKTTLAPYAKRRKIKLIERSQLSELGNANGPQRTEKVIHDLIEDGRSVVVCTHRPALPTIVEALATYGNATQTATLKGTLALAPGDMTVIHLARDKSALKRRIVSVETYTPGPPTN